MAAQPFARPALENNIGAATREFIVQFKKALERAVKREAIAKGVANVSSGI
jgi:hypothetical protein